VGIVPAVCRGTVTLIVFQHRQGRSRSQPNFHKRSFSWVGATSFDSLGKAIVSRSRGKTQSANDLCTLSTTSEQSDE
jgi:hypothetical protein